MTRREYVVKMQERYKMTNNRQERVNILTELVEVAGYNRKYATRLMGQIVLSSCRKKGSGRKRGYLDCLATVALVWEALDYCCPERLYPK